MFDNRMLMYIAQHVLYSYLIELGLHYLIDGTNIPLQTILSESDKIHLHFCINCSILMSEKAQENHEGRGVYSPAVTC